MRIESTARMKLTATVLFWMMLPSLLFVFQGCNDATPSQTLGPDTLADSQAIASPDSVADTARGYDLHLDPSLPPQKSRKEIDALNKRWGDAWEADREFLMTDRLEKWLKAIPDSSDADGYPIRLKLKKEQFAALDAKELLAYQMFHPEEWSQNCAEFGVAAGYIQAISRNLPYEDDGDYWSERQMAALIKDSVAVGKVVLECLSTNKSPSIPLMRAIAELKVKEAILPLIDIYESQEIKDDLILTTLVELMERANYWKWVYSPTCKLMVVSEGNVLPLDAPTIAEILKFAREFAES